MSQASVRRERFLPYAYDRSALELELVACTRDDEAVALPETKSLELFGPWRTALLELRASVPSSLTAKLVPPTERKDPPLALLVALRCPGTRLRRGEVIPIVASEARGVIRLRRDELVDAAELHAWLVRTKPHAKRAPGHATAAGARVAHAATWTVLVDRERAPSTRGLDVKFKSFATDPAIPTAERANLWRLDAALDEPVLWLNLDHGPIAELLRAEGTRGQRARQRDVVFDRIIATVRAQLLLRAATHLATESVYAWERAVIDDALPKLYPHLPADERLERLRIDASDPADLLARLDDVTQASEHTAAAVLKLLEESA